MVILQPEERKHDWDWTIFACPHPFVDATAALQTNAIRSWQAMRPQPEVILLGDEAGTAEAAVRLDCCLGHAIDHNEFGTPLISSIFKRGQHYAETELVCYANADVFILGLADALRLCAEKFEKFLLVGRRWDVPWQGPWDFSPGWEKCLREYVRLNGKLHSVGALDYFAFPKDTFDKVPPFAIGRSAWDNWFVMDAVYRDIETVDASESVFCVHQGMPGPSTMTPQRAEERRRNRAFYDTARAKAGVSGSAKNCKWRLTSQGQLEERR